ncbi:MAG: serine/threonine protein kinase [Planctomyces sp.]|nr:serine/threonine protein kinase [Planctomyces sp.]
MDSPATPAEGMTPSENVRLLAAVFCPDCRFTFELPQAELPPATAESTDNSSDSPVATSAPFKCPRCGSAVGMTHAPQCSTHLHIEHDHRHPASPVKPRDLVKASNEVAIDGQLIGHQFGPYECEALLGAGAMGRVYLARHRVLKRFCAIKILPPALVAQDREFVDRFHNEGQAAAALNHPNIVAIYALGEIEGLHYLEMEFVPGMSVRQRLEDEGLFAAVRATSMVLRIAEGLGAAHRHDILHRDLKPDNVLLTHQGIPKIGDFGLARRTSVDGDATGRREVVGTPQYMAPELFQGNPATPASDVYSLGVIYYQLLTNRLPFPAANIPELIQQVSQGKIPSVRDINPRVTLEMAEALHQLMDRTPGNRPRSGIEAARLLEAILGQEVDLESLVAEAFRHHANVRWSRHGEEGFRIDIDLPGGRKQAAFIEPSEHAAVDRLVTISSICCEATPTYYETALRLNAAILHGGLAIREIDGVSVFVMLDTYPRSTIDPEEIRRSVLEVGHQADSIEKLLTGGDRN